MPRSSELKDRAESHFRLHVSTSAKYHAWKGLKQRFQSMLTGCPIVVTFRRLLEHEKAMVGSSRTTSAGGTSSTGRAHQRNRKGESFIHAITLIGPPPAGLMNLDYSFLPPSCNKHGRTSHVPHNPNGSVMIVVPWVGRLNLDPGTGNHPGALGFNCYTLGWYAGQSKAGLELERWPGQCLRPAMLG